MANSPPEHTLDLPARLYAEQARLIVALERAHAARWPAGPKRRLVNRLDGLVLVEDLAEAERHGLRLLVLALEREVRERGRRRAA